MGGSVYSRNSCDRQTPSLSIHDFTPKTGGKFPCSITRSAVLTKCLFAPPPGRGPAATSRQGPRSAARGSRRVTTRGWNRDSLVFSSVGMHARCMKALQRNEVRTCVGLLALRSWIEARFVRAGLSKCVLIDAANFQNHIPSPWRACLGACRGIPSVHGAKRSCSMPPSRQHFRGRA